MTIEQELAQAILDRDAARAQAQQNFADYQTSFAKVTELGNEVATLNAQLAKISAEFSALAESNSTLAEQLAAAQKLSDEALNEEVTRVLSSHGHAPIALGADNQTAPNAGADAELYERFKAADPITSRAMLSDPKTGPRIRLESARRHKQP